MLSQKARYGGVGGEWLLACPTFHVRNWSVHSVTDLQLMFVFFSNCTTILLVTVDAISG